MGREAGEVAVACCKSMILNALKSKVVAEQLENLPPYQMPTALDLTHPMATQTATWQQVQANMGGGAAEKKQQPLLGDSEFHDFLEYFISETVFNVTSEMVENLDIDHENNDTANQQH